MLNNTWTTMLFNTQLKKQLHQQSWSPCLHLLAGIYLLFGPNILGWIRTVPLGGWEKVVVRGGAGLAYLAKMGRRGNWFWRRKLLEKVWEFSWEGLTLGQAGVGRGKGGKRRYGVWPGGAAESGPGGVPWAAGWSSMAWQTHQALVNLLLL